MKRKSNLFLTGVLLTGIVLMCGCKREEVDKTAPNAKPATSTLPTDPAQRAIAERFKQQAEAEAKRSKLAGTSSSK
jgi:hypothetical protein